MTPRKSFDPATVVPFDDQAAVEHIVVDAVRSMKSLIEISYIRSARLFFFDYLT